MDLSPTGARMPALILALSSVLCTAACRDNPVAASTNPVAAGARFVGTVVCAVDVRARASRCERIPAEAAARPQLRPMLIRDARTMVETGSDAYTPADSTYRLNIRLLNDSGDRLGTRDGSTVTGIRAFIPVNVMGYAGRPPGDTTRPYAFLIPPLPNINALVKARNPDGRMGFTAPDQPYWNYTEALQPGATSQWREWAFTLDPRVSYFYFAVSVFAAVPGEPEIPAKLPRGLHIPERYWSRQFLRPCDMAGLNECVYDAIAVRFRRVATQLERQVAIEAIDGVLEGYSEATGEYFVRVPGDSTYRGVIRSLDVLRSLPQVERALPWGPRDLGSAYYAPNDGADWKTWQVSDSAAKSANRTWALEAISAPLAWGCDTGAVNPGVSIVDSDFEPVVDLAPNLIAKDTLGGKLNAFADSIDHGTKVASIMSAVGNNGVGMTGMMWRSRVPRYEVARDSSGRIVRDTRHYARQTSFAVLTKLMEAVRDSATAVNLSFGFQWSDWAKDRGYISLGQQYDPEHETDPVRMAARDTVVGQMGSDMGYVMDVLADEGYTPLIVLGAGNDGVSAHWHGYTHVSPERRKSLIVVGAVRDAGSGRLALSSFSNRGDTVDIVAPGENIWTMNRNGPVVADGTSLAAPFVTGTAGLLLSFDPRLRNHGDSIKELILQGARAGGRTVVNGTSPNPVPVLHAYEALKAAAQRKGAPLCGNRLWTESRRITVQRGAGLDTLVSFNGGISRDNVDVLHGGRSLRLNFTGQFGRDSTLTYVLQNGGWQQVNAARGWAPAVAGSGGSYLSWQRRSHNGDTLVSLNEGKITGYSTLDLTLTWPGGGSRALTQLKRPSSADGLHSTCLVRSASSMAQPDTLAGCTDFYLLAFYSTTPGWSVLYHPLGGKLIVVSTLLGGTGSLSGWSPCPWPVTSTTPAMYCRSYIGRTTFTPPEVRIVDIASNTERLLYTLGSPGNLRRVTADESGRDLMFLRSNSDEPSNLQPTAQYRQFQWVNPASSTLCVAEVRSLATGTLKSTIPNIDCLATDHGIFFTPVRSPAPR